MCCVFGCAFGCSDKMFKEIVLCFGLFFGLIIGTFADSDVIPSNNPKTIVNHELLAVEAGYGHEYKPKDSYYPAPENYNSYAPHYEPIHKDYELKDYGSNGPSHGSDSYASYPKYSVPKSRGYVNTYFSSPGKDPKYISYTPKSYGPEPGYDHEPKLRVYSDSPIQYPSQPYMMNSHKKIPYESHGHRPISYDHPQDYKLEPYYGHGFKSDGDKSGYKSDYPPQPQPYHADYHMPYQSDDRHKNMDYAPPKSSYKSHYRPQSYQSDYPQSYVPQHYDNSPKSYVSYIPSEPSYDEPKYENSYSPYPQPNSAPNYVPSYSKEDYPNKPQFALSPNVKPLQTPMSYDGSPQYRPSHASNDGYRSNYGDEHAYGSNQYPSDIKY